MIHKLVMYGKVELLDICMIIAFRGCHYAYS